MSHSAIGNARSSGTWPSRALLIPPKPNLWQGPDSKDDYQIGYFELGTHLPQRCQVTVWIPC